MNKKIVIGIAIMAMAATAAQAATIASSAGVSANWTQSGAWGTSAVYPGQLAGSADIVQILGNSTITINSDIPEANALGNIRIGTVTAGNLIIDSGAYVRMLTLSSLLVGNTAGGTLVMNGGTVTGKTMTVSQTLGSTAGSTFAMHGGTIDLEGQLWVGKFDAGYMTMDGGNIFANSFRVGETNNGTVSAASLTGGTLSVTGSNFVINTTSTLELGPGGTLVLNGDAWTTVEAYVNSLNLIWDAESTVTAGVGDKTWHNWNGDGYLHTDYDAGTGKTTVWVNQTIPEPATVGMLGLGALVVLLARRMRG